EALSSERLNATFINYKDDSLLTLSSQGSTN
ncbi:metal ABC transporter ATP-binding protein, partial [Staphylococcus ureilyticus]